MPNTTRSNNTLRNFWMESNSGTASLIADEPITNNSLYIAQYCIKKSQHIGVRKKYIRATISALLITLTFHAPVFAKPNSYYRFTSFIYEQDEKINQLKTINPNISSERIDEELVNELLKRKEQELEKNCLNKIQTDLDELKKEFDHVKNIKFKDDIISSITEISTFITNGLMILTSAVDGGTGAIIGAFTAGSVASIAVKIAEKIMDYKGKNTPLDHTPLGTIVQEMRALDKEYRTLKEGLKSEPIADLERQYVKKKRLMVNNPSLQAEVERGLIQSRVESYYFQLNTPAIDYALGLPLSPKPLLDINKTYLSKQEIIKKFYEDNSFSIYAEDVKLNLLDLILRTATNSVAATSKSPLRVVEHWLGSGSTGKSTAAKAVARFLELPYLEKRITNPGAEINIESISGALRSFQGSPVLGWLAEALLQKTDGDEKESYQNGFLILDDFPVNDPNAQSLLLATTDPEKKNVPNNYLQANLAISRLNMIIISNEDFISLKQEKPAEIIKKQVSNSSYFFSLFYNSENANPQESPLQSGETKDPTLTALKSRFKTIIFPEFTEEQKGILVKPYLEETLVSKNKPPFFYCISYVNPTEIKISYDLQALNDMGLFEQAPYFVPTGVDKEKRSSITVRELKEVLERTISSHLTKLIKTNDNVLLEDKALNGNPEAITALVKKELVFCKDLARKQEIMRRLAKGHEKSGNLNEAKECLINSFELMDGEIWPQVSKLLPKKIQHDLDQRLLKALLTFLKTQGEVYQLREQIGNHLYETWRQSTDNVLRNDCLKYGAVLGNREAFEEMVKIHLFPRFEIQNIVEGVQERLHQNALKRLIADFAHTPPLFTNDSLKDKNYIYRKIINSTISTDHYNLLIGFLNIPDFFKLFSPYQNRQERFNNFIENFMNSLKAFDTQSEAAHFWNLQSPEKINFIHLREDLEKLKIEYRGFEEHLAIGNTQ